MTNNYFKEMIRLADSIADQAHSGQTDKIGRPYITHPRRVACAVRKLPPRICGLRRRLWHFCTTQLKTQV